MKSGTIFFSVDKRNNTIRLVANVKSPAATEVKSITSVKRNLCTMFFNILMLLRLCVKPHCLKRNKYGIKNI